MMQRSAAVACDYPVVPCEDAGKGSAKRTAESDADDAGEGKVTCKRNLTVAHGNANANDPGIGQPFLVLYWKPNQAEVGTEEERDGRGDAEDGGECEEDKHAQCRGELRNQVTQFATEVP